MESTQEAGSIERTFNSTFWCATIAVALFVLGRSVMNMAAFPLFDTVFPYARDISVAANAILLLGVGYVSAFKPRALHLELFVGMTLLFLALGSVMTVAALFVRPSAASLVLGASFISLGRAGVNVMVGLVVAQNDAVRASVAVTVGFTLGYAFTALSWLAPMIVGFCLYLGAPLATLALVRRRVQPTLDRIAESEAPLDVVITQPNTFLPLASQVFVCLFMFHLAFGFAMRFGEVGGVPVADFITLVPLGAVAIGVIVTWHVLDSDAVVRASLLLFVAGFFLVNARDPSLLEASSIVLSMDNALFSMVAWVVLAAVAHRNPTTGVSAFAWGSGVGAVGSIFGASLGVWGNQLFAIESDVLVVVSMAVVVALVGYLIFAMQGFSFGDTVMGVVRTVDAREEPAIDPAKDFDVRCASIAGEYGLTPRESEVFKMLACGKDRAAIEEELVISRNTVKAHVKHIYAKLGIHSHPELLALIHP
ncbi:helix-turn-helix domain-containing protein [Curtanaerobium respiraculi]|uniref:helix-turn-helix domain-containing protein n=1 Tax=Curtanaerobium respiraculi TaxID=2949669 RepID=UPI0024B3B5BB|nr:helix-turn-helix transcriptional regulator [Curtanaerobium respiraculi]